MLVRRQRIKELKDKRANEDALANMGIKLNERELGLVCHREAKTLMDFAFKMAVVNEKRKFRTTGKATRGDDVARKKEREEIFELVDDFIELNRDSFFKLLYWAPKVHGVIFSPQDVYFLKDTVRKVEGDIIIIVDNCLHGLCALEEENYTRFSQW